MLILMKTKKLTVYKSNEVIEAGYKLSLNEQRVVLACIGQVNSAEELLVTDEFELSAKDFANIFSVSNEAAYLALLDVAESLFKRYVIIDNPDPDNPKIKQTKTHWISSIDYLPSEGKIILTFAQKMLSYLSELRGAFTRYSLEHIGEMTSVYAIRLYELLMQWKTTGTREVKIDWLKRQFKIEDKYPSIKDLKKRVIEPAVKDINTYSNYRVEWTQRKTGRRVTHLTFIFSEKSPKTSAKLKTKEPMIDGVAESVIKLRARAGESWAAAAFRIKAEDAKAAANMKS